MPSGKQKDINVLRPLIRANGFNLAPSGSGHWRVLDAKGRVVTDENGPLIISSTSSETRSRTMSVNRLMKAGVLKTDPWKPQKAKEGGGDAAEEPDEQERQAMEAAMERTRADDFRRTERTRKVRERIEPLVVMVGGWDKRGVLTELGEIAYYFSLRMALPDRWRNATAASENADAMRKGATLGASMASQWEKLMDELEAWPDIQGRYMMLLREAKGLADPSIGDGEPEPEWEDEPEAEPLTVGAGSLALEVMFEMGVGRADSLEKQRLLRLGERILRLEVEADRPMEDDWPVHRSEDSGVKIERED